MALRTPEFTVPQPIPSPIYQAFNLGLQHLVELPFQIGAEKRAMKREKEIAGYQQQLGIQAAETESSFLDQLHTQSDIEDNYVEATPENTAQLRQAGMDPANLYRGFNGKQYLPKSTLMEASRLNSPVDTGTQNLLTGIMGHLVQRKIIPAAILGNGPNQTFTHKQLEETLPVVSSSLQLASLDQQDALRQMEMDLAAMNRREMDETRIFSLLQNFDESKTLGFGVNVLDANGNPTGQVRPMTQDERVGYQNSFLDVIADFEKGHGGISPSIQRMIEARNNVGRAGIAALPYLSEKQLSDEAGQIGADATNPQIQWYALEGMRDKTIVGDDGNVPTDWSSAAAILKSNPRLLRAMIASHHFRNGYTDLVNSEALPNAAQFDPIELEYLNNIFAKTRRATATGGAGGTPEQPSSFGGGAGTTPKPKGLFSLENPATPGQGGPTQFFSPFSAAPPTASFNQPSDYQDYTNVVAQLGTRLKQDPSLYPRMQEWVDSSLSTPDAAVQFFRTHGFDQSFYQGLTTGTAAQREAAWKTKRIALQWALHDAYTSATESPNNTVLPQPK